MAKNKKRVVKMDSNGPTANDLDRATKQVAALPCKSPKRCRPNPPEDGSQQPKGTKKKKVKKRRPKKNIDKMSFDPLAEWQPKPPPPPVHRALQQKDLATGAIINKYGMKESRVRLEAQGFHPAVTTKTPKEVIEDWMKMKENHSWRPTDEEWEIGAFYFQDKMYSATRKQLTRGLLALREAHFTGRLESSSHTKSPGDGGRARLEDLLEIDLIGSLITKQVFKDGVGTVQNLALASIRVWKAVFCRSYPWDFTGCGFRHFNARDSLDDTGGNGVFLALNPEYTAREVEVAYSAAKNTAVRHVMEEHVAILHFDRCLHHKFPLFHWAAQNRWKLNAEKKKAEKGLEAPKPDIELSNKESIHQLVLRTTVAVKRPGEATKQSQFASGGGIDMHALQPYAINNIRGLRQMLSQISTLRAGLEVLYFEKTPFLDRRVLATIIRACPSVTVIGVYECPLVHFGDLICILDLIHEVNLERKKSQQPLIKGLDFSPLYHAGMPYEHQHAGTYGITWAPQPLELVQRGFYAILMKAFLKAKAMRLDLLFSKGKALMKFLSRMPTQPLGVPSFLSALHRYLELDPLVEDYENLRRMALYDLLKPVRLGLDTNLDRHYLDWPKFYMKFARPGNLVFCCSCGYETFEDFFENDQVRRQPLYRRCAGCILSVVLDIENDHLQRKKRALLDPLFPNWSGLDFNLDAPLPQKSDGILRLESTGTDRPLPPPCRVLDDGTLYSPPYMQPLLRDKKEHQDSLQNLPTLSELVDDKISRRLWGALREDARALDRYRLAMLLMKAETPKHFGVSEIPPGYRSDGGQPDHRKERQPPRRTRMTGDREDCYGLVEAEKFHQELVKRGW